MLDVPFVCQRDAVGSVGRSSLLPAGVSWGERSCAIACAAMVLAHFGRPVTLEEVLDAALAVDAFDPARGWCHAGIVGVLQSFGLAAYRRNWRLLDGHEAAYLAGRAVTPATRLELAEVAAQMLEEGIGTIDRLVASGVPVIVSVHRPWGDRASIGHQIVLLELGPDAAVVHDPASEHGADVRLERERLFANWKGTAIIAHPPVRAHPQ